MIQARDLKKLLGLPFYASVLLTCSHIELRIHNIYKYAATDSVKERNSRQ